LSADFGVAWAGPRLAAHEAIELLRRAADRISSRAEVCEALNSLETCELNRDLKLVGWVREGSEWSRFVYRNMVFEYVKHAEPIFFGSGADDLRDAQQRAARADLPASAGVRLMSACRCVLLKGYMMQREVSLVSPLLTYAGGGWEAATLRYDRLEKLEIATHLLWDCQFTGDRARLRPVRALKNFYRDGYLFVRTADLEFGSSRGELELVDESVHIVGAPGMPDFILDPEEFVSSRFDAPVIGSHALLREG